MSIKKIYDVCVVGGGIVGLTAARALLRRHPKLRLAVVEKEKELALHQTRWSSGVVHAGIYYTPGTQRAKLCVDGAVRMEQYCIENQLPYEKCGKLIVATKEDEIPRLKELMKRGLANNVRDIQYLDSKGIRGIEPNIVGLEAIYSPHTGIADFRKVALKVADEIRAMNGDIILGFQVSKFRSAGNEKDCGYTITSLNGDTLNTRSIVSCAGLYSDHVSGLMYGKDEPKIIPFRGDYLELKLEYSKLVKGLVYPVPDPNLPFLGVHFTKMVDGSVTMGPTATLAFAKEGYNILTVNVQELTDCLMNKGLQKMLARYWKECLYQGVYVFFPSLFVRDLQKYMPSILPSHLQAGHSGVRAQAITESGRFHDDFVFDIPAGARILHVRNAPSPAATSSFAIADSIAEQFEPVVSSL